jgi:hypothetical protein
LVIGCNGAALISVFSALSRQRSNTEVPVPTGYLPLPGPARASLIALGVLLSMPITATSRAEWGTQSDGKVAFHTSTENGATFGFGVSCTTNADGMAIVLFIDTPKAPARCTKCSGRVRFTQTSTGKSVDMTAGGTATWEFQEESDGQKGYMLDSKSFQTALARAMVAAAAKTSETMDGDFVISIDGKTYAFGGFELGELIDARAACK